MTSAIIHHIQSYIVKQIPKFQRVYISWFGGEPTLCKDTILELSHLVQSLQEKYKFDYCGQMTTNGYLLNLESFLDYYGAGITAYQIH